MEVRPLLLSRRQQGPAGGAGVAPYGRLLALAGQRRCHVAPGVEPALAVAVDDPVERSQHHPVPPIPQAAAPRVRRASKSKAVSAKSGPAASFL